MVLQKGTNSNAILLGHNFKDISSNLIVSISSKRKDNAVAFR